MRAGWLVAIGVVSVLSSRSLAAAPAASDSTAAPPTASAPAPAPTPSAPEQTATLPHPAETAAVSTARHLTVPPGAVLDSAWVILSVYVGSDFARQYLTLDSLQCRDVPAHGSIPTGWSVAYRFRMPGKPWIDGLVTVAVDLAGRAVADDGRVGPAAVTAGAVDGIGDCAAHPERCAFPIDRDGATKIAKEAGLAEGVGAWEIQFLWNTGHGGRYVWSVRNRLHDEGPCSRSGESILIDAITGQVVERGAWDQNC